MATITEALSEILLASTDLIAIVQGKIYPSKVDDRVEAPYVEFRSFHEDPATRLADGKYSWKKVFYELQAWSPSFDQVDLIKQAIEDTISGFNDTVSGVKITGAYFLDADFGFDSDRGFHNVVIDISLEYQL